MDEMKNIGGADMRPIFIDKLTGYLLTLDSATGKYVPVLGSDTMKPIKNHMVYVDALTGCYCAIDMKTNHVTDVVDPATGKPMVAKLTVEEDAGEAGSVAGDAKKPAVEFDEGALVQADADDGSALESGPSRREGEPSLMELIEQMEEEAAAGKGVKPEPADAPAATSSLPQPSQSKQPDYLQMLPHINTRDPGRSDGASIATLIVTAMAIVAIAIGQLLYWALY